MITEFAGHKNPPHNVQKRIKRALRDACFSLAPADSRLIYRFAKRYVNLYASENNADMETNGELHFLQQYLASV